MFYPRSLYPCLLKPSFFFFVTVTYDRSSLQLRRNWKIQVSDPAIRPAILDPIDQECADVRQLRSICKSLLKIRPKYTESPFALVDAHGLARLSTQIGGIKIAKIEGAGRFVSRGSKRHSDQESEQLRARRLALERARQANSQQDCFNAI